MKYANNLVQVLGGYCPENKSFIMATLHGCVFRCCLMLSATNRHSKFKQALSYFCFAV